MTSRVDGLNALLNEERMQLNPVDAVQLGVSAEDTIKVTSARGSIKTRVVITDLVPTGVVCMSFHFAESPANVLASPAVCSMSVVSELKVSTVRIEKATGKAVR